MTPDVALVEERSTFWLLGQGFFVHIRAVCVDSLQSASSIACLVCTALLVPLAWRVLLWSVCVHASACEPVHHFPRRHHILTFSAYTAQVVLEHVHCMLQVLRSVAQRDWNAVGTQNKVVSMVSITLILFQSSTRLYDLCLALVCLQ